MSMCLRASTEAVTALAGHDGSVLVGLEGIRAWHDWAVELVSEQ